MRALVSGGAGYIGSHMCKALAAEGHDVLVLDNLSTGHRAAVKWGDFVQADLLDAARVDGVLAEFRPDVVFHFAGLSVVRDSMSQPFDYYRNNVVGSLNLLSAMQNHDVGKIVFSSSAAVYGTPVVETIDEMQVTQPINPYGTTKLMVERMLGDAALAYGLRSVSLRYFNAAGADLDSDIGEAHEPETHLIPNALRAADESMVLDVFGTDYATPDGTCIRDYVHVVDLADAHLRAAGYLDENAGTHRFNLGTGTGCSVLQIVGKVREATGCALKYRVSPRRQGDPARLVASNERARSYLGWEPRYSDLRTMVDSAWAWHRTRTY
ncbi:UDP-galactose 4-epimerase [Luteibacter rhizovicinus]|uniref:UDP-glucose 4-epimerase n=1 Tax=Luteibacter rhizovicinus TaxID=242606 RepID=A0A4R3YUD3_9GAMM|nr:UDP-glucose 4-epimerase GalE [Luteibacter rhizovicinus]TCV94964.1 UDP-galactose 4-epimerase [Luteibacter rhizovicinus]